MAEWQKMISGQMFENGHPEIRRASLLAKGLCRQCNYSEDRKASLRRVSSVHHIKPPFIAAMALTSGLGKNF